MELKIKTVRLNSMTNETHTQFHDDSYMSINKRTEEVIATLGLTELLALYTQALNKQKSVLDIVIGSKYTKLIAEKDHDRDQTLIGFKTAVKSMHHHFDPAVRQAAERVNNIFRHYGNIPHRSNDEETAAIEDLIREFSRTDLTADLNTLNVMSWHNRLVLDNSGFITLTQQRYDEIAALPAERMRNVRKDTDKFYRSITQQLELLVMVNRITPALTSLITDLNVIITHL